MKIISGVLNRPQKVVVYGPEGIGKSTFASHFPDPLFLDIEDSTSQLDVKRIQGITSWEMLLSLISQINQERPCKTVVIDTADWAEKLCIQHVCAVNKKGSIEDFGYGSGYVKLLEEFAKLLEALNLSVKAGINVVLNAHAQIRKFEQPDEMGAYDRWELKLNKKTTAQTAAIVKEWTDALLFINYKTVVVADDNGKKKGVGGKRVMYTQHASTWDAKNRWGLPMEMPFEFASIAKFIPGNEGRAAPEPVGEIRQKTPKMSDPQPPKTATAEKMIASAPRQATIHKVFDLLKTEGVTEDKVRKAVAAKGYYPETVSIMDYDTGFLEGVILGAWPQIKAFIDPNNQ